MLTLSGQSLLLHITLLHCIINIIKTTVFPTLLYTGIYNWKLLDSVCVCTCICILQIQYIYSDVTIKMVVLWFKITQSHCPLLENFLPLPSVLVLLYFQKHHIIASWVCLPPTKRYHPPFLTDLSAKKKSVALNIKQESTLSLPTPFLPFIRLLWTSTEKGQT